MDNTTIAIYAIFGLLVIFFIVMLVFSAKSWRWLHITFTLFVFAGVVTFLCFSAMVLKTQKAWREKYNELEARLAEEKLEEKELSRGNPQEALPTEPNIFSVSNELSRILIDRARVWRGCIPTAYDGTTLTLNTAPEAAAEGAPAPTPNKIDNQAILYVFTEGETADGWSVPETYLGEFAVTAVTDTTVSLTPTLPVDPQQKAALSSGQGTMVLYEMMPVDRHRIFASGEADDEHIFGRMDEQQLATLMPNISAELMNEYVRDGDPAEADDPPENVWTMVRFTAPHEITVDADSPGPSFDIGRFDPNGRAVVASLQQGDVSSFDVGDRAFFDQTTAEELVTAGVAEKLDPVYVRSLNDYKHLFHDFVSRMRSMDEAITFVARESATLTASQQKLDGQIALKANELTKLAADRTGFRGELALVNKYLGALETQKAQERAALATIFKANKELREELARLQEEQAERIRNQPAETSFIEPQFD